MRQKFVIIGLSMAELSTLSNFSLARRGFLDLGRGLASWRVWHLIGIGTIRRRYTRSRIGQFWTTISMGIMISVLGLVWSTLWKQDLHQIFPYIACSLVLWAFLTGTINDATTAIISSNHYFLNQGMSFSTPIYAAVYGQFIILLHNLIIVVVVLIIYPPPFSLDIFLFVPGFLITLIMIISVSCMVGILCARYRDLIQLISSILTTALYVTPVIFKPEYIPENYRWINFVNPFAIFLAIMRDPLFGREVPWEYWAIAATAAAFSMAYAVLFIGKYSKRVLFWI